MLKSTLFTYWKERELELGKKITIISVAKEIGVAERSISKLMKNELRRFDDVTISKICRYFDVPDGAPIPFLVFTREDSHVA